MTADALTIFQKGFNYSQDGPGNRLVYHLQGCNLACRWCSNPEGIPAEPPLMAVKAPLLDAVCPHGGVRGGVLDRSVCRNCAGRECVTVHRNDGLVCRGHTVPLTALRDEALRSRGMFFDGGGITLTGGEPTRQFGAVKAFLAMMKAEGISTAMETNGSHPDLPALFPLIDTLMMDFKHPDSGKHREFTGAGNETIRANIRAAAERHPRLQLRTPLIGGFNGGEKELDGFLAFFRQLRDSGTPMENVTMEFLRYHEYGKEKWAQCGWEYRMENGAVSPEWVKRYEDAFRESGFRVVRT